MLKVYKITTLFYVASICLASAQNTPFEGNYSNTPLRTILDSLETQSGISFYYLDEWIEGIEVSTNYSTTSLDEAVGSALANTDLNHALYNGQLILTKGYKIRKTLSDNFLSEKSSQVVGDFFERDFYDVEQGVELIEIGNRDNPIKKRTNSIKGRITDLNGNALVGALVYTPNQSHSATSGRNGDFIIELPSGRQRLLANFVGMQGKTLEVIVFSDGELTIELVEKVIALDEFVVESDREENIKAVSMGLSKIDVATMEKMPKILGEVDLFKVITTLPGVQSAGEGTPGIYVRGGGADQNLILIDGAPIYNTSHFLGFFSAFNSETLAQSELYKSSLPAKYGGRLSSVLDISTRNGSVTDFGVSAGISPITSHVEVDLPIIKDKVSLLAAGRSTYSDWILQLIPDSNIKNSEPSFYDITLKLFAEISEKDQISATAYRSNDEFRLTPDSAYSYQNVMASINWNHAFSDVFSSNLTLYSSEYEYTINFDGTPETAFDFDFSQKERGLKLDLDYLKFSNHDLNGGFEVKSYNTNPGAISAPSEASIIAPQTTQTEEGIEAAVFLSDTWNPSEKLGIDVGLRYSWFAQLGPDTYFEYLDGLPRSAATQVASVSAPDGSIVKTYQGPEFRISGRYSLNSQSSIKAAITSTRQYIHQLSNTVAISPIDTWKLSDVHIQPQRAIQYSMGYYRNINQNIETSIEGYVKTLDNQLNFVIGADLIANETIETDVFQGEGLAYGIELFARKRSGRMNGWTSYAWSRSLLKAASPFQGQRINDGAFFPSNFDQPHSFNAVVNYDISRRYSLTTNFTYRTGRPITFPTGQYSIGGVPNINYSTRNKFRVPDYLRWDIAINIEGNHKVKKLAHSSWTVSIYNILGRDNVFSVFFERDGENIESKQLVIFGSPIPSITYNLKF